MNSQRLKSLYTEMSKHSHYQKLNPLVEGLLPADHVKQNINRFETERFSAISSYVNLKDSTILDVGGNTGFFSFEGLAEGAKKVIFYEGNRSHCEFVKIAADILKFDSRLDVYNKYYAADEKTEKVDLVFLLNVLHHIGDDFGSVESASGCLEEAAKILRNVSRISPRLVFQMGFNWQGDPKKPLFANGSKSELIDWVSSVSKGYWKTKAVLIANRTVSGLIYEPLNSSNVERNDSYGEFLNRPLFIFDNE